VKMEDARNLLINYVGTAADIDLILEHYGVFTTDEAIKNGVNQFTRKFIAIGTEKRNAVLTNLAKSKLTAAKKFDLWSLATLATTNTLQEVIDRILDELRPSETKEISEIEEAAAEVSIAKEETAATTEDRNDNLLSSVTEEQGEQQPIEEEPQAVEQTEIQQQEESKSKEEITVSKTQEVGACTYGVPIIPVVRVVPNVFGLKESLLSDFTKEELNNFFNLVKSKVTPDVKE
jgi:hypothetical protein